MESILKEERGVISICLTCRKMKHKISKSTTEGKYSGSGMSAGYSQARGLNFFAHWFLHLGLPGGSDG